MVDKNFCMSSYLAFRTIIDDDKSFKDGITPILYDNRYERKNVYSSLELEEKLRDVVEKTTKKYKTALCLSGGIDSAILAKFIPKGSVAYTFRCVVPGVQVTDETPNAAIYAKECGLEHRIVDIYREDLDLLSPALMKHKGAPMHSIEIQIYKAALQAKADGFECLIFGESADLNYGGLSNLHSREWSVGEFMDRYFYVKPWHALKEPVDMMKYIIPYEKDGKIDIHEFCRHPFYKEAMGSYTNACDTAGIVLECPYAHTYMGNKLDINRIRNGQNKYLVREIFERLYPDFVIPQKLPMPRATNEWFASWEGPTRPEFWPHCTDNMDGDQRWYVYALEKFLNLIEGEE